MKEQKEFRHHHPGVYRLSRSLLKRIWIWILFSGDAWGYTANKVWFEFRPEGIYRVYVNYTVPELKEFRESYVEFRRKKAAEKFYFDLLRGADFFPPNPEKRRFEQPPKGPRPW